jgi:MFS family permease
MFFAAVICMAAAMGIFESIFNNYLDDTFEMAADSRGILELPREFPGFMVVVMAGVLCMLTVTQLGIVGAVVFAVGTAGIGLWGGRSYGGMIILMMIHSAGLHLLQPVTSSIALSLADSSKRGMRMAQVGIVGTVGMVGGTALIKVLFNESAPAYTVWFVLAAGIALIPAVLYYRMHLPHLHQPRARMVIRKRFSLYYALEFLFGARKQIFLTFGFWVLVKEYEAKADDIAGLLMTAAIIGLGFKPMVGWTVDRFGPRAVMVADGFLLAVVCIGYGYARHFTSDADLAFRIASACFVADSLLFALGNARSVYVSHLTESHQELTSTLAMGVSINHIASMVIPMIGGAIWMAFGYERVFTAAAVLALGISAVSTLVPKHGTLQQAGEA